jgi:hypothetical protein
MKNTTTSTTPKLMAIDPVGCRFNSDTPQWLVVRRVKRLQPLASDGREQGELFATYRHHDFVTNSTLKGELFATYRHHDFVTNSTLSVVDADQRHRDHATVEQVIAELKSRTVRWRTCRQGGTRRRQVGSPAR